MGRVTPYRKVSEALECIGFIKESYERQRGVTRSWWSGPKCDLDAVVDSLADQGVSATLDGYLKEIKGRGWNIIFNSDGDLVLSVYQKNEEGQKRRLGLDVEV